LTPTRRERNIRNLPGTLPLEIDGWTSSRMHYVALSASYMKNGIHNETLLALPPLWNEELLGEQQHSKFIEVTLQLYDKVLGSVVACIGDNCTINRKISNDSEIHLIGCVSH
jgi:hypothetical protein